MGNGYLTLPGTVRSYVEAADSAGLSVTGDIDVRMKLSVSDWTPAGLKILATKWGTWNQTAGSGTNNSWIFYIAAGGALGFIWSANGNTDIAKTSTAANSITDGATSWVRATLDVDNGASGNDLKFYTSSNGTDWTQLGDTVTTANATSIFDGTAGVGIGVNNEAANGGTLAEYLTGTVYEFQILNGIAGTAVASADFTSSINNVHNVTDAQGNVWNLYGGAAIVGYTPSGRAGLSLGI